MTDRYAPPVPPPATDTRGVAALLAAAAAYIVGVLLWSVLAHWTLYDTRGLRFYALLGLAALPLLWRRYRGDARICTTIVTVLALTVYTQSTAVFSYFTASTNLPLVDAALARWDRALGFDWVAYCQWLQRYPLLDRVLSLSYDSLLPQFAVMIIYLAYAQRYRQLSEFCGVLVLSKFVADAVSACFPAAGASKYFAGRLAMDVSLLSDFEPLRSGALTSVNMAALQGLISIPSFHTILALAFIHAMRGTRLAVPFLLLNALMLLSTPKFGGHYLVDMLAGALVFAAAVPAWRRLAARWPAVRPASTVAKPATS